MANWKAPIQALLVPLDRIVSGQVTVPAAGTAVSLGIYALKSGVTVKALAGNTNNVYVGDDSVDDTTGFILAAGEQVFIEAANLSLVYIDVDTNDEGVSYIGG